MSETAIDQIWYTWSSIGLGNATGFRVRAASNDVSDLQGKRYSSLGHYLRYQLPQDVNPYKTSPAEAPVCLALLKTELGERILVHKVFTGRDGFGRAGVYFTHLLAGLPASFSASDAILLWASSLWQVRDILEEEQPTRLPQLSSTKLEWYVQQSQVNFDFSRLKEHMRSILTTYLSPEQPRIFLVGKSEDIAALIWGLTHSLPKILCSDLTFSTYEQSLSASNATIVGTAASSGVTTTTSETNHQIIYCDETPPVQSTRSHPTVARFITFALECLPAQDSQQEAKAAELQELLAQAETHRIENIRQFIDFLDQFWQRKKLVSDEVAQSTAFTLVQEKAQFAQQKAELERQTKEFAAQKNQFAQSKKRQEEEFEQQRKQLVLLEEELHAQERRIAQQKSELEFARAAQQHEVSQPAMVPQIPAHFWQSPREQFSPGMLFAKVQALPRSFLVSFLVNILLLVLLLFSAANSASSNFSARATATALVQASATKGSIKPTPSPTLSGTNADYTVLYQSDNPTFTSGSPIILYLVIRNGGNAAWPPDGSYQLVCLHNDDDCQGIKSQDLTINKTVPPQSAYMFVIKLTAPNTTSSGQHSTEWQLERNKSPIPGGPQTLKFFVK